MKHIVLVIASASEAIARMERIAKRGLSGEAGPHFATLHAGYLLSVPLRTKPARFDIHQSITQETDVTSHYLGVSSEGKIFPAKCEAYAWSKTPMSSTQPTTVQGPSTATSGQAQHLGTVVWALFFIWAGVVVLAAVPWGWFLLGVGLLVLAAQSARWQMGMEIEGFWIACGIVFLAAGLWNIFDLPWPLPAIMLIALGAVLLGKVFVAVRH